MADDLKLLIVEDNEDDAWLLLREITRSGDFDVKSKVAESKETFERLLCDESWDVIICDYNLVGITADDIVRILDSYSSNIPVIIISGSMTKEMMAHTRQAYLSKDNLSRVIPLIHRELNQVKSYHDVLLSWGTAIELKDQHTSGHTMRVTQLSIDLAVALKLCWPHICSVRIGAYLHDVGKIMVRDEVLLKPGKLNAEEMEEMKRHTLYGYQLLKPMHFMRKAIDIPRNHHERWDGTGYPDRLMGEDIPLFARIFAVPDNYDALTSDRPYRKALSSDFALKFISENAGKMFDPVIVDVFIKMMEEK